MPPTKSRIQALQEQPASATMSAASPPIPQAGDEPVWVKDDDEDLEELVDLTGDAEIASSHQIDLQARLRPRAQFGGLG